MLYQFLIWILGMPVVELVLAILTIVGVIMPPLLLIVAAIVILLALVYFLLVLFSPAYAAQIGVIWILQITLSLLN